MTSDPRPSFAEPSSDAADKRLFAPSAQRNRAPIIEALTPHISASGLVLEIASGTGEHAVGFVQSFAHLTWQPTEIDPERLASIEAWTRHASLKGRILPPIAFNPVTERWQGERAQLVYLSNLLHLISEPAAKAIIATMADAAAPGGMVAIYGPFLRADGFASEGDEAFDEGIRRQSPEAGYKAIDWTESQLSGHGLTKVARLALPANNLLTLWIRSP
ncbi:MAG: DUF938 domain-containing protein [Devosiaceae bacterium]|nr:DUF938 domain-containing protein [Devosiaceae bacterium MH13]